MNRATWIKPQALLAALAIVGLVFYSLTAHAQPRGGGQQLPPERQEAAWKVQAEGVAKELGLNEEQTKQLVDAYVANRRSNAEALRGLAGGGGGGGGAERFQAMQRANESSRAQLREAVSGFLNEDQTGKAVDKLGTYSRQWDRMVDAVSGLGLEGDKRDQALKLIADYTAESDAATRARIAAGGGGGGFQGLREEAQARREKLDNAMAEILTEDQLTKWKADTAGGGFGGGGFGGGRGGAGGGQQRGPAPGAAT